MVTCNEPSTLIQWKASSNHLETRVETCSQAVVRSPRKPYVFRSWLVGVANKGRVLGGPRALMLSPSQICALAVRDATVFKYFVRNPKQTMVVLFAVLVLKRVLSCVRVYCPSGPRDKPDVYAALLSHLAGRSHRGEGLSRVQGCGDCASFRGDSVVSNVGPLASSYVATNAYCKSDTMTRPKHIFLSGLPKQQTPQYLERVEVILLNLSIPTLGHMSIEKCFYYLHPA